MKREGFEVVGKGLVGIRVAIVVSVKTFMKEPKPSKSYLSNREGQKCK